MKYCGGTFSGHKLFVCVAEIVVVGHRCTYEGRLPEDLRVATIRNWGPCKTLSEVRAFLGTVGVIRIFIKNFAKRAHALIYLTRKDVPFEFGPAQLAAQEELKKAVLASPALRAIDYASASPVILAVDTSYLAVGFHLCQCDPDNPRTRYYNRFGSITLNEREARFSQAKLEIYGLFRAFRALRLYLIGIRNLVVEVDARYIKGMLQNPDIAPSASINRWIMAILTFHFHLVHIPGTSHGPDGLSRRPRQPGDVDEPEDDFDDWIDRVHGFIHLVLPSPCIPRRPQIEAFIDIISDANPDPAELDEPPATSYTDVPCSDLAIRNDYRLELVRQWHKDLKRPPHMNSGEFVGFLKYCFLFFIDADRLWRKDPQGAHKLVVDMEDRLRILRSCHDEVGHRGTHATHVLAGERFWWPFIKTDVAWYV